MPEDKAYGDVERSPLGPIAVLGSSGFIGTHLTLNLIQAGARVRLLYHRTDPDFVSPRGQIETIRGSINDDAALIRCFTGCGQVYHLVGIIAETRSRTFQQTVAEGTAAVVAAAKKAGVRKIIYLSALGTSENAESEYFRTKWQAERHVLDSGLGYTVFRPSVVYGLQDNFINRIASMVRRLPAVPVIGDGRYRLQPVYVEELCAVMARASREVFTDGKTYEVGGPEQLTYNEILDIIQRVLNRKPIRIHVPIWSARMAAAIMEKILAPAPLTRDQIKMMAAGSICDHTVVEREFNVSFSRLEVQLQKYLRKP